MHPHSPHSAPQAPAPAHPRQGLAIAALTLGIVGGLLSPVPIVGVIAWPIVIVGLVLGIIAIVRARREQAPIGMAATGTALSATGLVICFLWLVALGASANQELSSTVDGVRQDASELEEDLSTPMTTPTPAPAPATPPAPKLPEMTPQMPTKTSIPGDGTFLVGEDIEPGTYRTAGPDGFGCYWERLGDLSGGIGSIVDNGIAQGSTVVKIASSDAAFRTQGCASWELVE